MKVVVVVICAKTILNENPGAEVVVYERNDNVSFLSCGIALYVAGLERSSRALLLKPRRISRFRR